MARQRATQTPTWLGISHDKDAGGAPALDGLVSAVLWKGHKALLGWDNPRRVVHREAVGLRLLLGLLALPTPCRGQGKGLQQECLGGNLSQSVAKPLQHDLFT